MTAATIATGQETTMTHYATIGDLVDARHNPAPPPERPPTVLSRAHGALAVIVNCPAADEAVELVGQAAALGAGPAELAPVLAVLRDLAARLAAARQYPAPAPVADDEPEEGM